MSRLQNNELIKDIFAYGVLLVRLGFEECISSKTMFIAMVNEVGFRTVKGKQFTSQSFMQMVKRLDNKVKVEIQEEFSDAIELLNSHGTQQALTESIFA